METGTGKTYVYIKTMFELNKRYGWSKFIVVVPSIAIREGVGKSFRMLEDHFMEHYGKKARWFIYDSSRLKNLDDFSSDAGINVMIINTQAFAASLNESKNKEGRSGDKAARIIYSKRDDFASRRPIDVIAANRPIIIMDEPQKMEGEATQTALKRFMPLFILNYSATHKTKHNTVYALDRTLEINLSDISFTLPLNFNAEKYYAHSVGIYVDEELKPTKVKIRAYGNQIEYLRSLPLHRSQKEGASKFGEFCEFEYKLCLTPELSTHILAMGENVEVLEPVELREEIKRRICLIYKKYDVL